jgi:Flp pilus assembly protein CpaB
MTYRLRNILIALGLAIVAALLTTFYVANYKKHVQRQHATVTVVVATKDIPVGLTGDEILKGHYLTTQSVERTAVAPGALSDPNQIANQVATQAIYNGEQVTARRFGAQVATGIRGQITDVYRAYQLPGDGNQLLVGTLQAGDHVDILANIKYKATAAIYKDLTGGQAPSQTIVDRDMVVTRIILRDVKVLQVSGGGGRAPIGSTGPGSWVMLALTDDQTQKLLWIQQNATWWFALRPVIHDADSPNTVETIDSVLGDGLKFNEWIQLFVGKAPTR